MIAAKNLTGSHIAQCYRSAPLTNLLRISPKAIGVRLCHRREAVRSRAAFFSKRVSQTEITAPKNAPMRFSRNGMRFYAECSVLHSLQFCVRARLPLIFNRGISG
jgi:hypothetical protein